MADVSLAALALRLAVSMGVVIGLMVVAAKLLRRAQAYAAGGAAKHADLTGGTGRGRRRGRVTTIPIAVTSVAPLTRTASVAVVRAAGREMVLGVTETQVTLLHSSAELRADLELDHDLDDLELLDEPTAVEAATSSPTPTAARIAAVGSGTPDRVAGMPAWTDALETLRAMTVRH